LTTHIAEGGRRPDEGGFIKNNAKNLRKNLTDADKNYKYLKEIENFKWRKLLILL
jgi:hypothetical protein